LDIIYKKIHEANDSVGNPTTIRILNTDFDSTCVPTTVPVQVPSSQSIHIPSTIVTDVKKFLSGKGYSIAETEDTTGVSIGWRLSW
jgi:hypothetical protein